MRLDSIVFGMDFSEAAIRGARWISDWFAPESAITFVHVIDLPDRPHFAPQSLPSRETVESVAREFAETEMESVARFVTDRTPRFEIRLGKPHEQIAAVAREAGADLIAIGPHGDRPRRSSFLGTTADRIVRTSITPVLVLRNTPSAAPRNLLVPVDDAPITPAVLDAARSLATTFAASVTLLHVWSNAVYSHVASMAYATSADEDQAKHEIEHDLHESAKHWLDELADTGFVRERASSLVTYGSAGESILQVARATSADLIVMGGRGAGLVAPALLGSTVRSVLEGTRCSVLVVRDRS